MQHLVFSSTLDLTESPSVCLVCQICILFFYVCCHELGKRRQHGENPAPLLKRSLLPPSDHFPSWVSQGKRRGERIIKQTGFVFAKLPSLLYKRVPILGPGTYPTFTHFPLLLYGAWKVPPVSPPSQFHHPLCPGLHHYYNSGQVFIIPSETTLDIT